MDEKKNLGQAIDPVGKGYTVTYTFASLSIADMINQQKMIKKRPSVKTTD